MGLPIECSGLWIHECCSARGRSRFLWGCRDIRLHHVCIELYTNSCHDQNQCLFEHLVHLLLPDVHHHRIDASKTGSCRRSAVCQATGPYHCGWHFGIQPCRSFLLPGTHGAHGGAGKVPCLRAPGLHGGLCSLFGSGRCGLLSLRQCCPAQCCDEHRLGPCARTVAEPWLDELARGCRYGCEDARTFHTGADAAHLHGEEHVVRASRDQPRHPR
mmetsp:Transcript_19469/g.48686  ORF Transcript_19469/g.48686 Transcript_19469/m.48686 type:complete len:215 (-) Transcript_19469:388-1032(-)